MHECMNNLTLKDFVSQVFGQIKPNLLKTFKNNLEEALLNLRDQIIGNQRYQRGSALKRWGFTVRKYIATPLGRLEQVRIPRIRNATQEVRLFIDRYCHFSKDLFEQIILAQAFNMSTRKLSVWIRQATHDWITYPTLSKLIKNIQHDLELIRQKPIPEDIQALIVDGLWTKYRKKGKAVLLVALGLDSKGTIFLLDWQCCSSENTEQWFNLFKRLKKRGLDKVTMVTGDGSLGLPAAVKEAFPSAHFQLCLWHLWRDLAKKTKKLTFRQKNTPYHHFWEVFNAFSLEECYQKYLDFLTKWGKFDPKISTFMARYENNLFHFYLFPEQYRHRLRTVNMAEGFFKHLRDFVKRFPGFIDEKHLSTVMTIFLFGINKYRADFYQPFPNKGGAFVYAF